MIFLWSSCFLLEDISGMVMMQLVVSVFLALIPDLDILLDT